MNGANLSTYVYQGKKKSTQFTKRTHTEYTADPHRGYIIDNQSRMTHKRDTCKAVYVLICRACTHERENNRQDLRHHGGRMLAKTADLLNIASLIALSY